MNVSKETNKAAGTLSGQCFPVALGNRKWKIIQLCGRQKTSVSGQMFRRYNKAAGGDR